MTVLTRSERPWWRDCVTYQIYIRSFADSNGDGKGDVEGIRSRLPYLKTLGIDAIWITPWYPSPQIDHGYDVADYMDIEPDYGTLDEAKRLIDQAHALGIKLIIDIVPNHSSDKHKWFQEALKAAPGSLERERYIFRDGKGNKGELPPNNWQAIFGGPAWERITEADGTLGQWYLHLFAVEQPDFNWENPVVREHFEDILHFWLKLGVDGFRIDVAHGMIKEAGLPDELKSSDLLTAQKSPYFDQEGVHEIYRAWRKIFDSYPGHRMGVAEAWVSKESLPKYIRPDIKESFELLTATGAPASWVLENHDVTRSVNRFDLGLRGGGVDTPAKRFGNVSNFDIKRGTKRARAAALLMLALPGGAYIYQGEELALPEATGIPKDRLTDPRWKLSGYTDPGRDGCRVPIPWRAEVAGSHGFSSNEKLGENDSWLPQPKHWGTLAVELQEKDPESTLNLYRAALALRHSESGLGDGTMEWIEAGEKVIAFNRPGGFVCYVNFGKAINLPAGELLLGSNPVQSDILETDTAVWMRIK
jgi:alpha-glucosidase